MCIFKFYSKTVLDISRHKLLSCIRHTAVKGAIIYFGLKTHFY